MINLFIDTRDISEQFELTQSEINGLLDFTVKQVTARFAQEWENEAFRTLKSSRADYINNIVVVDEGFAKGAVMLTGWLPNAVENGIDGYDLKESLLNGPNAKTGVNGKKYNTVPFSFGTPNTLPENFSGGLMPEEVYNIVKNKPIESSTGASQPLKADEIPAQYQEKKKASIQMPESKSFKEYQHKHSIYEGISKRKDSVTGQNTYGSFRRVSENSDDNSWQHPGIEAHDIAGKALQNFAADKVIGNAIDTFLENMGG